MKKMNDKMTHPLRFEMEDGRVIGQFYNSWDKLYHLAEYVPYEMPPSKTLCGKGAGILGGGFNFSSSRAEHRRELCPVCWKGFDAHSDSEKGEPC